MDKNLFEKINLNSIANVLRIIFGLIFLFSAVMKFLDIEAFADAIENFDLIGGSLIPITQYSVPILEIILGFALIFNYRIVFFSQTSVYLLIFFTSLVTVKVISGEEISCGCFGGISSDKIDEFTIIRNLVLISLGIFLVSYYESKAKKTATNKKSGYSWLEFFSSLRKFSLTLIIFFFASQSAITGVQNRILKNRLIFLAESGQENLVTGDTIKTFSVIDEKLEQQDLVFPSPDSSKTLLFIMSTNCKPCKNTLPNWKYLWEQLNNDLNVISIAINPYDHVKYYKSDNKIPFNIFTISEDSYITAFKEFKTPQTILVDNNGIVERSWVGQLWNIQVQEIISFTK